MSTARGASQLLSTRLGRRRPLPTIGTPTSWTSALDRFARSVYRYQDRVIVIGDRRLRSELQEAGAGLTEALSAVRALGPAAPVLRTDPTAAVRAMLRSGTLCAQATERACCAAEANRRRDAAEVARLVDGVRAAVSELRTELEAACGPASSDAAASTSEPGRTRRPSGAPRPVASQPSRVGGRGRRKGAR